MNIKTKQFNKFHADNPHVYDLFRSFTFQVIQVPKAHYSARAIFDRIRWFSDIETVSDDPFKISNNHSPFYARLFMRDFPQHKGFFITKEAEADVG